VVTGPDAVTWEGSGPHPTFQAWNSSSEGTAARALRCLRRGCGKFSLWRGNNSLRSLTMRKMLGIAVVAVSLIGNATVVLAQSSRNLMEVTGTEANRVQTQYGRYTPGSRSYAYSPRLHRRWHWSHRRW